MHYRARFYDPRLGRFGGKDPILGRRALSHYLYASNDPVMRSDPLGEEDLYTDGGTARWVVENRGTFVDSDVEEVRIGTVSGDQITLDAEFGGGTISVAKAKEIARSHAYMGGVAKSVRHSQIRNALRGNAVAMEETKSAAWASVSGFGEGFGGGAVILADTFTFESIEGLHSAAESYQGASYDASRFFAVVAREGTITVLTLGGSTVVQAGRAGLVLRGAVTTARSVEAGRAIVSGYSAVLHFEEGDILGGSLEALSAAFQGTAALRGGFRAAKEGVNVVYRSVNAAGQVQYVGITNNLARRAAEHLASKGIKIQKLLGGLSRADARGVEQALIEIHGLGKSGGTLLNRINSIARSNPAYAAQVKRGYELLRSIGY